MGRAAVLVMMFAGCFRPSSQTCSDGTICPENFLCDVENHRCLTPDEIAACDGLLEGADCSLDSRPGACRNAACEVYYCGDGYRTGTETCDVADLANATCLDAGFYDPDGLACNALCVFDTTSCGGGYCGDTIVNGPELCDGTTSRTCIGIGFDAGSLSCDSQCGLSIQQCTRFGWNPESLSNLAALAVGGSSADDQWAVGDQGRAMHFEGAFWNAVPTGVTNPLVAVWSIARDDAWTIGLGTPSIVLHWDGLAWSIVAAPTARYVDVWAANANAVYAASTDLGVQAWDGTAWTTLGNLTGYHPIAIRGTSPTDIWVATSEGPLVHWNGTAWSPATLTDSAIHFIDANAPDDVWVVGSDDVDPELGVIAHWNGSTWRSWRSPETAYANVASSAPNDTWVAGVDGVMRHYDGVAWAETTTIGASPSGVAAISGLVSFGPSEVVAVSTLNLAYRFRGQVFGRFPTLGPDPFSATENTSVWGAAANDLYVGNVKGEVWHFDGVAWSVAFTVPLLAGNPVAVRSVWGSGPDDVWVGAVDGRAYHHDGTQWTGGDVSTTTLDKMWGSGPGDVWAFSSAGAFHRTGATWTRFALGNRPIISVSGTGANDIWAVDRGGTVWHWQGTTWAAVATGATQLPIAVVAVAPDDVHVSAKVGRMEHWNGSAWSEAILPAIADLAFLTATGADDVIAASQRELFHFDGTQWAPMRTPIDFVPNTPDYIPMAAIQSSPGRVDILLERFRVRTLIRTRPIVCRGRETNCADAVDDDCDGRIDGIDPDCP